MDENNKQLNDKNIKVLRTYTSDMADAIRTNEFSVIKIALAEKEKREQEDIYKKAEGTTSSKIFLVTGGIILITAAIIGSYFLFKEKKEKLEVPLIINEKVESFINYEKQSSIDVSDLKDINELVKLIKQNSPNYTDEVITIFLKKKINNIEENIISKDFFNLINSTAPNPLIRSISDEFLIGKYLNSKTTFQQYKSPLFLVFKINNYGQAYASMLDWEKTMLSDLKNLFEIELPIQNGVDGIITEKKWKDIIVNNRDVRVVYGENGEAVLYYVFINDNNLIIGTELETIKEIIERLIIKNNKS